jgi:hypothetical protein
MNQTSPPLLENSLRWTYDGTMDDMVTDYPWPGISAVDTTSFLDSQLAYSVVTGSPMLLNDGYLVLNQACLKSLRKPDSPLRILIRKHHVKVLARHPNQSLEGMVRHGAKQNVKKFEHVLNSTDWSETQRVLAAVEAELRENDGFVGWPGVDLSRTYWEFIRFLASLPPEVLLRDGVPYVVFNKVAERFDNAMNKEAITPRTKWEEITKEVVREVSGTQDDIDRLMHLANEVYHHNFGAALQSRPPVAMRGNVQIAVQTRISDALSRFSKTHTLDSDLAESVVPEIDLPWKVDCSANHLIALFDEDVSIGRCRKEYLKLRADYRLGKPNTEEVACKRDEYQRKLNEHLFPSIPTPVTTAAVAAGLAMLTDSVLGHAGAHLPAIVIGVLGAWREECGIRTIMEKWQFGNAERKVRLKLQDIWHAISRRQVVTSLSVDPVEAHRLVGSLPELG